jgi:hypothetical protein
MPEVARWLREGFCSLRLTVVLLLLAMVLIFAATLDQVHLGVWGIQEKYFHAWLVLGRVPGTALALPIFPGGYLLGGLLLLNLVVAHGARFRLTPAKTGIWLTHLGLILLLAGEGASGLFQRDGQIRLDVGATQSYLEDLRVTELAVIETTRRDFDQVTAIPATRLAQSMPLQQPSLPFLVRPVAYYPNAHLRLRTPGDDPGLTLATVGSGVRVAVEPAPMVTKAEETNWPAALVELAGPNGSLGIWLVSTLLAEPQEFSLGDRSWRLALRPRRDYLPFSLQLLRFTHDVYPGTEIPRNFASLVRLRSDDGRDDRAVRIVMNRPLRYRGFAFYQAGYDNNDRTSVFQAVRNPGWTMPYLSCGLIAFGLLLQFGLHLRRFLRREPVRSTGRSAPPA